MKNSKWNNKLKYLRRKQLTTLYGSKKVAKHYYAIPFDNFLGYKEFTVTPQDAWKIKQNLVFGQCRSCKSKIFKCGLCEFHYQKKLLYNRNRNKLKNALSLNKCPYCFLPLCYTGNVTQVTAECFHCKLTSTEKNKQQAWLKL